MEVFRCQVPGIYVPLMAMIDYRGYRLLAMSILPIDSKRTLRYGSEDGGLTIACNLNPALDDKVTQVAGKLNLKPHVVTTSGIPSHSCELAMPVDIEVHEGIDGKFYMLGTLSIRIPTDL